VKFIKKIYQLIKAILRVRSCGIEIRIYKDIIAAYIRLIFLQRYDSRKSIARIGQYKVNFCSYYNFINLFNGIFINNEYYFVSDSKSPYIIDCGSNIGMSVLYFKMLYPESNILAFEPSEDAFACLMNNISMNNLKSVIANNTALSNKEGTVDFYYDLEDVGSLMMSTKRLRLPKLNKVVRAEILSKYINRDVDLLKIDVEGAELEIIEELCINGNMKNIIQVIIEYHHHIIKSLDEFSRMLSLLENAGFGYQIESSLDRPLKGEQFQNILVYAYNKNDCIAKSQ